MIRIAIRFARRTLASAFACMTAAMVIALSGNVIAQQTPGFPSFNPTGEQQMTFGDSRDRVDVTAFASPDSVAPGGDLVIVVVLDHQSGWHTWPNAGNLPAGTAAFEGAINTTITATANVDGKSDEGKSLVIHDAFIQWPATHNTTADIGEGPREYAVFSDRAIAYLPVSVKANAIAHSAVVEVTVSFQTCNDRTCMAPADVTVPVRFEVMKDATALASARPSTSNPADLAAFDASAWAKIHASAMSPQANSTSPTGASDTAAAARRPTFFGISLPRTDGAIGLVVLTLLSMLGGLILNLTPCVLPIIPIKILTISQHAHTPGRGFILGLWMALGVVAFWAGIGVPAALFTAAADPSRMFGIWWLTLAIGVLIGAMGVGIMGLFTLQLPSAVYAVNPKADSTGGSFLFGVMTAVLGLPCFGFVAGALLAGSATLPPAVIMLIFTSIGVGMAAPYLVLAAKPGLVERIPRTGPASELVKQVMGLLLLAAAAYFVGSGLITLVIDYPHVGRQLHWWAVAVFATAAGLWLVLRTFQITARPLPRITFVLIGALIGAAGLLFAIDRTRTAQTEWERMQVTEGNTDAFIPGAWNDYTPARFAKARKAGHIVVLDFTASWCLTCQVLKAAVLDPEPVKSAFEQKDVVVFTVDLSSNKAPGWQHLRDLGETGIPMLAIYTPGVDRPWHANAYTAPEVLGVLEQARASKVAIK